MKHLTTFFFLFLTLQLAGINANAQCPFSSISELESMGINITIGESNSYAARISTIGDINDDGIDDIAVVDEDEEVDTELNTGKVYIYFGKTNAQAEPYVYDEPDLTITDLDNSYTGSSVYGIGDFNGDDIDDMAIQSDEQHIIIYGTGSLASSNIEASTLTADVGFKLVSDDLDLDQDIMTAGDFDADGLSDFIFTAESDSYADDNYFNIVLYGAGDFTAEVNIDDLEKGTDYTEISYESISNSDRDILFLENFTSSHNNVLIFSHYYEESGDDFSLIQVIETMTGRPETIAYDAGSVIKGSEQYTSIGRQLRSAGDFNGDGYNDLMVSAIENNDNDGEVVIIYGGSASLGTVEHLEDFPEADVFLLSGVNKDYRIGYDFAPIGDYNNDGIDDVAVFDDSSEGDLYVLYGSDDATYHSIITYDLAGERGFSIVLDEGGGGGVLSHMPSDLDGDGNVDLVFGEVPPYYYSTAGRFNIVWGGVYDFTDEEVPTFSCPSDQKLISGSIIPNYLERASSFDDNCTEDIDLELTQSPAYGTLYTGGEQTIEITSTDRSGNQRSCTFLLTEETPIEDVSTCSSLTIDLNKLDGQVGTQVLGNVPGYLFGYDFDEAGDFNGDGIGDYIVGAPGAYISFSSLDIKSNAYLLYGQSTYPPNFSVEDLDGTNGFRIYSDSSYVRATNTLGYSVSSAGDMNGDGYDDIVVTDPFVKNATGPELGFVYVIYGAESGFSESFNLSDIDGDNGFLFKGDKSWMQTGTSADNLGDINDDGFDDIIVSAPTGTASLDSRVYVLLGSDDIPGFYNANDLNGTNGFKVYSSSGENSPGRSNSSTGLGDFNGDGIDDFAVGGTLGVVLYGRTGAFPAEIDLDNVDSSIALKFTGESTTVRRAGDLNGDGYDDIMCGDYVVFGHESATGEFDITNIEDGEGFEFTGWFGDLGEIGDINNDGMDDLILRDYIIYGREIWPVSWGSIGAVEPYENRKTIDDNLEFYDSKSIGDVNNDGIEDFMVSYSPSGSRYMSEKPNLPYGKVAIVFGFEIIDEEAPELTCLEDQTLEIGDEIPDYTILVTATDDCDADLTVVQSIPAGSTFTADTEITITATDEAGNESTCSFQLLQSADEEAPEITCPGAQELSCETATIPDYTGMVTVTDNRDTDPAVEQSPVAGSVFTPGMEVTITATDAAGNASSCSFIIDQAADEQAPELICLADQMLEMGDEIPDYTILVTATDDCDADLTVVQSIPAGSTFTADAEITITATDEAGNESTCSFQLLQSADEEAPEITCPSDQELSCETATIPDYTGMVTVTDNRDTDPAVEQSPVAGSAFTPGMEVTITATDAAGNASSCSFIIDQAADEQAPELICLADQMLEIGDEIPDYTVLVTATDDCDADLTVVQSIPAGSTFTADTKITITATDEAGNESSCSFQLLQSADEEAPEITCPSAQELSCETATIPDYTGMVTVTDNRDEDPEVLQVPEAGTLMETEQLEVQLIAQDESGNSSSCSFIINREKIDFASLGCIEDLILPTTDECAAVLPDFTSAWASQLNKTCFGDDFEVVQAPSAGTVLSEGTVINLQLKREGEIAHECSFNALIDKKDVQLNYKEEYTIASGEEVILLVVSNVSGTFRWESHQSLSALNIANPVAAPTETTTYKVVFETESGCTTEAVITVSVEGIKVSQGFSPDGNGINDTWQIFGIDEYPDNEVSVYNRWGDMVYFAKGYDNVNQTFTGQANELQQLGASDLPEGTYFYQIILGNGEEPLKGFLVLKK